MRCSKKPFYFFCVLLITAFSCKDKDPKADCGCEGSIFIIIKDANASYLGNGNLRIQQVGEDKQLYEGIVSACSISDTLKITTDIKNPDYIVSGNIKKQCFRDHLMIYDVTPQKFEVKEIKRRL